MKIEQNLLRNLIKESMNEQALPVSADSFTKRIKASDALVAWGEELYAAGASREDMLNKFMSEARGAVAEIFFNKGRKQ